MKGKSLITLLCVLGIGCLGIVGCTAPKNSNDVATKEEIIEQNSTTEVKCSNGIFKGAFEEETGVLTFKGIPYAKAPVGKLRWKAPVEVEDSEEHFDATEYGNICLQTESTEFAWGQPMGEDCLTLNVWTSDLETKNKPVMVWIHGGSYGWGGTNDPLYDAEYLVDTYGDLIVVTINYRLNLLGFIDFSNVPGGEEFPDAPYLGILDQQMALKWVQKNIENFGGDPENVTVFGESAGGGAVVSLLSTETSKGLFNRAIVQSGSGLNHSKEKYDDKNQAGWLLKAAGVTDMDGLMALSEEDLEKVMNVDVGVEGDEAGSRVADLNNFPMRDDELSIIPTDVDKAVIDNSSDIDIMIGTTGEEMRLWVGEMGTGNLDTDMEAYYEFISAMLADYGSRKPDYKEDIDKALAMVDSIDDGKYVGIYPDIWEKTDVVSEIVFRTRSLKIIEGRIESKAQGKNYVYLFNKRANNNDWLGACHACELNYVFNNTKFSDLVGDIDPQLAADVSAAWVAFARTGNPSTESHPWEEYNLTTRPTMVMNDDCTMQMENDPKGELREILKNVVAF